MYLSRKKTATLCLMLATFFLPFGYDALFALIMKCTGSYWITDVIFYFISVFFFGLYSYLSGNNPFKELADIMLSIYNDKIKHYFLKDKS